MRGDTLTQTAEQPRLTPDDLVGKYAIVEGPLQDFHAGNPYHTVRIEKAERGSDRSIYAFIRRVTINNNGSIVSQSDRVRLTSYGAVMTPIDNPNTAKHRADSANTMYRAMMADINMRGMSGEEHDARKAQIERILKGGW